jgi:hypothetical protein
VSPAALTPLQELDAGARRVDRDPAGTYDARGRSTTTQPERGRRIALEVFVFALEDGGLCAVRSRDRHLAR